MPTRGVRGAGFGPPGRGPPGPGRGPGVGRASGAAGVSEAADAAGAGGAAGVGGAGAAGGAAAAGAAGAAGLGCWGAGGPGRGPGRRSADGAGLAGEPLDAPAPGFTLSVLFPPNDSRSRRATGASTVDDADLTNSPCSPRRASTSLLVTPSSLANSCTRALPATTSPRLEATAVVGPRLGFSYDAWSSGLHGVLMFFATCSLTGGKALPPRWCPANRGYATLDRLLAGEAPRPDTAGRDATTHPVPADYPLYPQSRR